MTDAPTATEIAAHLAEIARQVPDAVVHVIDETGYGYLVDQVVYDPDNRAAVIKVTANE